MGDTGTQFLGVFLAAVGIQFLWNITTPQGFLLDSKSFLSAILTFALPIMDTTVVFVNRILKGSSPFVGGKDHTTHHLHYLGLKEPQIAILYSVYSGISMICVIAINKYIEQWSTTYFWLFSGYFILSLAGFFVITRIKKKKHVA